MKKDFNVGCVVKKVGKISSHKVWDVIQLKLPSRIHMSLLNDTRISLWCPWWWGLVMAVDWFNTDITMKVIEGEDLSILSWNSDLINYIVNLFCAACGLKGIVWLEISINKNKKIHLWFWSSIIEFFWILFCLNFLYREPLTNEELRKLAWYNYVEWNEREKELTLGYETWWWPACVLYGWLVLLTDKLEIIEHVDIWTEYKMFCFVPNDKYVWNKNITRDPDWENKVFLESINFQSIINWTSDKVLYELIPAMKRKNIREIWDIIEDLNFMMWTIWTIKTRYSVWYYHLFEKLRNLWAQIVGISSTGPTVYALASSSVISNIQKEMKWDIWENPWIFDISQWMVLYHNWLKVQKMRYPTTSYL